MSRSPADLMRLAEESLDEAIEAKELMRVAAGRALEADDADGAAEYVEGIGILAARIAQSASALALAKHEIVW